MVTVTCYNCKRRFTVAEQEIADGLARLAKANPRFYAARCPACHSANRVSLKDLQLPAPTPPAEKVEQEEAPGTSGEESEAAGRE
jgi:hypothetical protein